MAKNNKLNLEQHPLFPSGEWEGFYSYTPSDKHQMKTSLIFKKCTIKGLGSDDIGEFTWKGIYNKDELTCSLEKRYKNHSVNYSGNIDENGIWGQWNIDSEKGGFHLWPKGTNNLSPLKEVKKKVNEKKLVKSGSK